MNTVLWLNAVAFSSPWPTFLHIRTDSGERMFRDAELDEPKKTQAAERCRALCRARVVEEMSRRKGTSTEAHLKILLDVIDGPARFPLR